MKPFIQQDLLDKIATIDSSDLPNKKAFKALIPELFDLDCQFAYMNSSGVYFKLNAFELTFTVCVYNYDRNFEFNATEKLSELFNDHDMVSIDFDGNLIMNDD